MCLACLELRGFTVLGVVIPGYTPGSGVRCDDNNRLLINKHYCCCESIIENMISKSMFVLIVTPAVYYCKTPKD